MGSEIFPARVMHADCCVFMARYSFMGSILPMARVIFMGFNRRDGSRKARGVRLSSGSHCRYGFRDYDGSQCPYGLLPNGGSREKYGFHVSGGSLMAYGLRIISGSQGLEGFLHCYGQGPLGPGRFDPRFKLFHCHVRVKAGLWWGCAYHVDDGRRCRRLAPVEAGHPVSGGRRTERGPSEVGDDRPGRHQRSRPDDECQPAGIAVVHVFEHGAVVTPLSGP